MITVLEQMRHSLDNLLTWVLIIMNETDITIIIIIMMMMIMKKEVAKSTIILFYAQKFLAIKVHQLIFTNPLIRKQGLNW